MLIALRKRLCSRWDVKRFLESGAISIIQPDICYVSGISELCRIATMAAAYGVALAPHCPLCQIALSANVRVDAVSAAFAIQKMSSGILITMVLQTWNCPQGKTRSRD